MTAQAFSIAGSGGEMILGDAHVPGGLPRGVILIAHGFKGYKDYGMFPHLAASACAAGFIAHRFNFSHSGMTNDTSTFARPDLFEADTWNHQVFDVGAVVNAMGAGEIPGGGLPLVLFGHSRGGVTVLLAAGREPIPGLRGVMTAASPATCNSLPPEMEKILLEAGFLESPSSRTGQTLRVGRQFLTDQLEDPVGHDLLALVGRISCPLLIAHCAGDETVPAASAALIQDAATGSSDAQTLVIEGGNHVFAAPNPMPPAGEQPPSEQLTQLVDGLIDFAGCVCDG